MDNYMIDLKADLLRTDIKPINLGILAAPGDNLAHTFRISVFNGDEPAVLDRASCFLYVKLFDRQVFQVDGTVLGNKAVFILPDACYSVGGFTHAIARLNDGTQRITIADMTWETHEDMTNGASIPQKFQPIIEDLEGYIIRLEALQYGLSAYDDRLAALNIGTSDAVKVVISPDDWEIGTFNSTTGEKAGSAYYIRTKTLKPISPDMPIYFNGDSTGKNRFVWYYDKNSVFISRTNSFLDVPANARYVAFSFGFSASSGYTVESYGFDRLVSEFSVISESVYDKRLNDLSSAFVIMPLIDSTYDLDDLAGCGAYRWNTSSVPENSPVAKAARLLNYPSDADNNVGATQVVITSDNLMFTRYRITANWSAWRKLYNDDDAIAYIDQVLSGLIIKEGEVWENE